MFEPLANHLSNHSRHGTRWEASQLESHTKHTAGSPHVRAPHRAPGPILAGIRS